MNWKKIVIIALIAYAVYTTFVVREGMSQGKEDGLKLVGMLSAAMVIAFFIGVTYYWLTL